MKIPVVGGLFRGAAKWAVRSLLHEAIEDAARDGLVEEVAARINARVDVPWVDERTEQKVLEEIISAVRDVLVDKVRRRI